MGESLAGEPYEARGTKATYAERLAARMVERDRGLEGERWVGNARLAMGLLALAMAWLTIDRHVGSPAWLLLPGFAFAALVVWHVRVREGLARAQAGVAFYERGLSRLDGSWPGVGSSGSDFLPKDHPYAADLDLFGDGSIFQLVSTARTQLGEGVLARWLLEGAPPAVIRERQAAVQDLAPQLDLREAIYVAGGELQGVVDFVALERWSTESGRFLAPWVSWSTTLLSGVGILVLLAWGLGMAPNESVLAVLLAHAVLRLGTAAAVSRVVHGLGRTSSQLAVLGTLLRRVEQAQFQSPRLVALQTVIRESGGEAAWRDGMSGEPFPHEGTRSADAAVPASEQIRRIARLVQLLDSERNILFLPFAIFLTWRIQVALRVDQWRLRSGPRVRQWLAAIGEIEALCSLASFGHELARATMPELREMADTSSFAAWDLGHPLLPHGHCISNDVTLDAQHRLLVVSGSNMSGKSTLLRSIGVNAVLALAGAPVCAREMHLSSLQVYASIRPGDSLMDGRSRFYAEILRLKQIVEAAGRGPVLFLLDELLSGTNSHDRAIGARAIVTGLVQRGAVGLLSTHDLALTEIVRDLGAMATNVHFEERLEGDRLSFDYRLRPGVVQRSNAVALMRSIGLDV